MSLFQIGNFPCAGTVDGRWAVWQMEESEQQLLAQLDPLFFPQEELQHIKVAQRRQEWLGCRLALQALLPHIKEGQLKKNEQGKPYLSSGHYYISLSHAGPYAAAVLHAHQPVGVDIEQPRPQLLRIKHKFLSQQEQHYVGDDLQLLCQYWAAKEALYKMAGQAGLIFAEDMAIEPGKEAQQMQAWLKGREYTAHYQWINGLLMCVVA